MAISPNDLVSDELLLKAKELILQTSKEWTVGVCAGRLMDMNGKTFGAPHGACHAWVTYAFGEKCFDNKYMYGGWNAKYLKTSENFLTLSCHSKKTSRSSCSAEASDFIVLWMAKESPFSQFIMNRDDDESLTEGGVIILCGPDGATLAEAMWICKALRLTTEGAKGADTFMKLVQGGTDPLLALYVASHIREIKGAIFGYTGVDTHSSVFYSSGKTDLKNLLDKKITRHAAHTPGVFGWSGEYSYSAKENENTTRIRSFCKPYKRPDGWGGYVEGAGATGEELVERVLKWQKEISGETDLPRLPTSKTVFLDLDM